MIWLGGAENGEPDASEGVQLRNAATQTSRIASDANLATLRMADRCCTKQPAKTPTEITDATISPFIAVRAQTSRKPNDSISRKVLPRSIDLPRKNRNMALDETAITYAAPNPQPSHPKA